MTEFHDEFQDRFDPVDEEEAASDRDRNLRWRPDEFRGEARAEVNKLLAAVLENESSTLRRLLVFSVLIERATDLRDQEIHRYIEDQGGVIQPYQMENIAKLAGISTQTLRNREEKLWQERWKTEMTILAREKGCTCTPTFEVIPGKGRGWNRTGTRMILHHQSNCDYQEEQP